MKKNVGSVDRTVRIVIGVAIAAAGIYFQSWWGLVALLPLGTGLMGSCGAYSALGLSTCKVEEQK
ncbi:MAG: DUF2892 domain-containing protein [Bacteroidetes bacterium]|nr:DUF2892 domain-containing protein [Bacteroidota bacterium]MBU1679764.1 DUF2892 domain-containing protein [Bacteroidota bacterium]MBU2507732.1 DUF2892 domain-containing protein [Bacteroidota bacterium]